MTIRPLSYSRLFIGAKLSIVLLLASLLFACEQKADLNNPKLYAKDGVSFSLPSNWNVSEDVEDQGFRYVLVETSGDAIMVMNSYEDGESFSVTDYMDFVIEGRDEELPFGSIDQHVISDISIAFNGQEFIGKRNTFNMNLLGVSIPHTADFFMIRSESKTKTAYFFNQSADEDLAKVTEGFKLILSSFIME